jgi:hypothetical protein
MSHFEGQSGTPNIGRARYPGESRSNASATCAVYRIVNGARDTVAKFDREQDALACLHQLIDEQSTIADAHHVTEQSRADAELPALVVRQKEALLAFNVEQRAALESLIAHQAEERERVKALRPIATERYEVVQF